MLFNNGYQLFNNKYQLIDNKLGVFQLNQL